jgi:hypothetical protein
MDPPVYEAIRVRVLHTDNDTCYGVLYQKSMHMWVKFDDVDKSDLLIVCPSIKSIEIINPARPCGYSPIFPSDKSIEL